MEEKQKLLREEQMKQKAVMAAARRLIEELEPASVPLPT